MESYFKPEKEKICLENYFFNFKNQKNNELFLQISHSSFKNINQNKKWKFLHAAFNEMETLLALADHEGNIFIIDLETEKYWLLITVGIVTLVSFPVSKRQELLIGLDTSFIIFCSIENGEKIHTLKGHTAPATIASYYNDGYQCLTSSAAEAIVWDLLSYTQIHRLSLKPKTSLKKAIFIPVTHHILACFQDGTINIWESGTFENIKQIIPEIWKTHNIKDIAITKNGKIMVLGSYSQYLVIFCLETWVIKKVIELPDHISGIQQLLFIPQVFDGGANRILVLLTTSMNIYFFDIETSTFLNEVHLILGVTNKIAVSQNGKYLAAIFTSGTVNVFSLEKIINKHFLNNLNNDKNELVISANFNKNFCKKNRNSKELIGNIKEKLTKILDLEKILPILKEFGEYPELYRILIWKTILKLPENQKIFFSLSKMECHHSYNNLESKYPLLNKSLCNSLKKVLSNLSHWCPLFGEVNFLPEFIFPFVKLFHSDILGCFEVVVTVIVNWCQNWFEFYPFPPINMLCALENILGYHDSDLLEFYMKNNVTSSIFACPLFHTAFSEVLPRLEWLKFWDHVISNEPSFLFLAIIAYSVISRNAIKRLKNIEDIEAFFRTPNPLDVKKLIAKTYYYVKETPDEIHCRQFFIPFRPLTKGTYLSFSAYPKLIIDPSVEKLQIIRKEKEDILEELKSLEIKQKFDPKIKSDEKRAVKEKIYEELENNIRDVVEKEEDRLLNQKQKLRNLKRELTIKELEIFEKATNKKLIEKQKRKEMELERLIYEISKRKAREKIEVDIAEEEMQKYYAQLLLKKSQLESDLNMNKTKSKINLNENEYELLKSSKTVKFTDKLNSIKKLIDNLEIEIDEEIEKKDGSDLQMSQLKQLQLKVKDLEQGMQKLILKNFKSMHQPKEKTKLIKLTTFDESPLRLISTNDENQTNKKTTMSVAKNKSVKINRKEQGIKKINKEKQKSKKPNQRLNGKNQRQEKLDVKLKESLENLNIHKTNSQKLNSKLACESNTWQLKSIPINIDDLKFAEVKEKEKNKSNLPNHNSCFAFNTLASDYSFHSDSENEIFKSALKTRKQLLEMAKRRQKLCQ